MVVPGPFAPLPAPETRIGGVGFCFSALSAAVPGVRLTLGGADTFADCCSSRRRSAWEEEGGVLPTTTLFAEWVRSACERLTRGFGLAWAEHVAATTASTNPRISQCLIYTNPLLWNYWCGCTHPAIPISSAYPMLTHSRAKPLANKPIPFNEIRGTRIACPSAASDQLIPGTGQCANYCTLRASFPRRLMLTHLHVRTLRPAPAPELPAMQFIPHRLELDSTWPDGVSR